MGLNDGSYEIMNSIKSIKNHEINYLLVTPNTIECLVYLYKYVVITAKGDAVS